MLHTRRDGTEYCDCGNEVWHGTDGTQCETCDFEGCPDCVAEHEAEEHKEDNDADD